jgi:hypothetical protein
MDKIGTRALTSQLAEDLGWLEAHCRQKEGQDQQAAALRLAAALVRNCLGPFLDDEPPTPLHVAVVGGAGAGKSTVVNFLCGAGAAEANPQAGFTRHPIAYTNSNGAMRWPAHLGFLGPLQRLTQASPSDLDEDVYQVRRIHPDPVGASLLKNYVIWDCPDMTTWAATGYVPRLLEIAALADVVVYVASDERYNDEVPTQFLNLLLQTGKPVVVCLMKMKEADLPVLLAHFQQEVLARFAHDALACLAIPFLEPAQLADPVHHAARFRIPLLNQLTVLANPATSRRHVVRGAINYLVKNEDALLAAAREDVAALESWRASVLAGQVEFDQRYRREYLATEKFHSFDEALVRFLDLLELPGVGRIVSGTLWAVRWPYRLVRGFLTKKLSRPDTPALPEQAVLEEALRGWLDHLHKEAMRRAESHPVWAHLEKGFGTGLAEQVHERFQQAFRNFQLSLAEEVERTARAIYEELEKRPLLLNTLRGGNLALDVVAIGGAFSLGHLILWQDLILVPLLASIKHQIVELLGKQYVDHQREQIRSRQQLLVTQYISGPLAEWLAQWPATGGSEFERLQTGLRRIPQVVKQVNGAVTWKLEIPAHSVSAAES